MRVSGFLFVAAGALFLAAPANSAIRVWQDSTTLPTYLEGLPDIRPVLDALSPDHAWYPYVSRTNLTGKRAAQEWRRLNMENEYLICTFLPDLGGRLYSCFDKLNGHPVFYANPSIRKALIGVRGAGVALGLEPKFPASDNPATVSPSDFGFRQEPGRGVVWVGAVDRLSGLEWVCEFVLRSGSAMLEQTVTLRNPTAVRQRYDWWNNAAVELEAGTKVILPARLGILQGSDTPDTWPVNSSGVDQSVVANIRNSAGFFASGSHEAFMAVYHAGSRTATVHVADPNVVSGKKFWTWGTQKDAEMRKTLSENNSLYVEIQAGIRPGQDEFRFFAPHQSLRFTEYWIPARQLGGVVRATVDGVLNLERRVANGKPALIAELNVTHAIPGARVRIVKGAEPVLEETLDLDPAATFARSIPDPAPQGVYRFELLDRGGVTLLAHTEGELHADPPQGAKPGLPQGLPKAPVRTEAEHLERGEDDELHRRFRAAENDYRAGLEGFPSSVPLKKAYGRLLVNLGRFDEAARLLSEAVEAMPRDAEAAYYLGISRAAAGDEESARKQWERACPDDEFGPPALVETAASLARSGDTAAALQPLLQALERRPAMLEAGRGELALLRKMGREAELRKRLQFWLSAAPTDSFLRIERTRLEKSDEGIWQHLGADPERVLDAADTYVRLGFYGEALAILERVYPLSPANQSEPGAVLPQRSPLVVYYRGYLRRKAGGDAAQDLRSASALPLEYAFPHRPSLLPVLQAAVAANPEDASARWLLGLLYADSNLLDQALAEWEKAASLRPDIPALNSVLAAGRALKQGRKPPPAPMQTHKSQPVVVLPARAAVVERPQKSPAEAALMYAAEGRLDAAQGVFTKAEFPEEKQPELVRQAYIEIQLQRLRAAAAPGNCSAAVLDSMEKLGDEDRHLPFTVYGFGAFMKSLRFQFYLGEAEAACGRENAARKRWSKLAAASSDPSNGDFVFPALAATKLGAPNAAGKRTAAAAALEKLLSTADPETRGILFYSQGLLLRAAGQSDRALAAFHEGEKAPDTKMSHYLNLMALQDMN